MSAGAVARLVTLGATRGGAATMGAGLVTAVVCAFLPLADHLGFELGGALAVVLALFAPAAGMAAARLELERAEREQRPFRAALDAAGLAIAAVVLAGVVILLNALRRPSCDVLGGSVWLAILAAPSAALGATTGAFARFALGTTGRAAVLVYGLELGAIALSASELYTGPSFFLFDHFFGYFPGPLYDEVVRASAPVLAFRAMTLGWALVAALGSAAVRGRRTALAGALVLGGGLLATSWFAGPEIGFRTTDASLAEVLGGERRIDGLELHFPREWKEDQRAQFVADVRFRASQVASALDLKAPGQTASVPVRVWMYRSADEKRRLVGAGPTSFSKPWRWEIHIHASGWPHPVLRHELVHAYGGALAGGPFHVPGGLFPNTPLVEGFAVAFDVDPEGGSLDEWAKALRELKLAPDVGALLSATGFLTAAPARAYTYAGAFLRFLERRLGRAAVLRLYANGTLASVGDPAGLVRGFEEYLDRDVVLDAETRAAAERRYARPSVFRRRCAREVSRLTDEARERQAKGDDDGARRRWDEACAMEPDDPALLKGALDAAIEAHDEAARDSLTEKLLSHPKLDSSLRGSVLVQLGDELWKEGKLEAARARYAEVAKLAVDRQTHRNAVARMGALADEAKARVLRPLFVESKAEVAQLFDLADYARVHEEDALVHYLLGRQLVAREAPGRGAALLAHAVEVGLVDEELQKEALRQLVRARAQVADCDGADAALAKLGAIDDDAGDLAVAADWIARCRFAPP